MATFTGTDGNDVITPTEVSPGVTSDGAPAPDSVVGDEIDGGAGNDTIDGGGAVDDRDIVDGGAGNDMILSSEGTLAFGSEGDDTLVGAFNDVLFGGDGNDVLVLGSSTRAFGEAGNDTFTATAGAADGSDSDGGDGDDVFNGAGGNLIFHGGAGDDTMRWDMGADISSNTELEGGDGVDSLTITGPQDGQSYSITVGDNGTGFELVQMDHADQTAKLFTQNTEVLSFGGGDGADTIVVDDQTGLGVQQMNIDLGASATGGPDGQVDSLTLNGAAGGETFTATAAGSSYSIVHGANGSTDQQQVNVLDADANDQVILNGGDGSDSFTVSGVGNLTLNGGDGNDRFFWHGGATAIDGGAGIDIVFANVANASGTGGATLSAADGQAVLTTVADGSALHIAGVEKLLLTGGAGSDQFTVGDLTGTGLSAVTVDLGADQAKDQVSFLGTDAGDHLTLTGSGGAVTVASLSENVTAVNAGANDVLRITAGAGDDVVNASGLQTDVLVVVDGGEGADSLVGGAGANTLLGGAGDDTLRGGAGRNILDGGDGNDLIVNGDGSIGVGGAGDDTLQGAVNDVIQAGDGADLIQLGSSTQATGGAGNDTFTAAAGAANGSSSDGGDGDDVFNGAGGNLIFHGGTGDDTMRWDMGADISSNTELEGGDGNDSLTITGPQDANPWSITVGDNGTGFELVQMEHAGLTAKLFTQNTEVLSFGGGQGADTIVVNDQAGLGVQQMNIDLGASASGGGDGQVDALTLNGSAGRDTFTIEATGSGYSIAESLNGGAAQLQTDVLNADSNDQVTLNGGDGNDSFTVSGAGDLTLNGGGGNDLFSWAGGASAIDGGDGIDIVFANVSAFRVGGATLSAADGQAVLTTVADGSSLHVTGVEKLILTGGATTDLFTVGDLTGTGLSAVTIDLGADQAKDQVSFLGTDAGDHLTLTGSGGAVTVASLSENVTAVNAGANDVLRITTGAGDDVVNASGLQTNVIILIDGGTGNDTLEGGSANTVLQGGDGSDSLAGGAGNDLLDGGTGIDTLSGGAGDDVFQFHNADGLPDIVLDFQAHDDNGAHDRIDLVGFGDQSFDDLVNNGHLLGTGDKVIVTDGTHVIATLLHTSIGSLNASDFLFG